jgi:hypothetical protein
VGIVASMAQGGTPKPFFVNLENGETTREDPGVPLLEDGSILCALLIA